MLVLAALLPARALQFSAAALRAPAAVTQQRCAVRADAAATAVESKAQAALLEEVAKPQRSLSAITAHVATLEAVEQPTKIKKAVLGDWKLTFASEEAAVRPFTTGAANGPFAVLEEAFCRLLVGDVVQIIEVVRRIGPFGNSAVSLNGKWSLAGDKGSAKRKGGGGMAASSETDDAEASAAISWRTTYMINERGREVDPPKDVPASHDATVTHISPELMVLRFGSSFCVFTKMEKGAIKKSLDSDYSVFGADDILGISS